MKKKILGIFVCMLLITTTGVTVIGTIEDKNESQRMETNSDDLVTVFNYPPDLVEGINVCCDQYENIKRVLAFDFNCTLEGWLIEFTLFGSWMENLKTSIERFHLTMYTDTPKATPPGYSIPNESLWSCDVLSGHFTETLAYQGIEELWWDPYTGNTSWDSDIYAYTFSFPLNQAFPQYGTSSKPIVYWLAVQAFVLEPGRFGLKTAKVVRDDAVRWDQQNPYNWTELLHPETHLSLDFAGIGKMIKAPFIRNRGLLCALFDVVSMTNPNNNISLPDLNWTITVGKDVGPGIVLPSTNTGVVTIGPGETATVKSKLVLGFGPSTVTVEVMGYTVTIKKYVVGFLILSRKY